MAKVYDLIDDADGDLLIKDGDFVVAESTIQHQTDLILIVPGELKQFPTSCVGLKENILDDIGVSELKKKIQTEFEADGIEIRKMSGQTFEEIQIDAEYGDL
jgi:hypothetical protein